MTIDCTLALNLLRQIPPRNEHPGPAPVGGVIAIAVGGGEGVTGAFGGGEDIGGGLHHLLAAGGTIERRGGALDRVERPLLGG